MQHELPRIFAMARPGPLIAPSRLDVAALAKPEAYDRWDAGVRAVSKGDNVITMFDVIGEDYWSGGGITAKGVTAQLRAIGDRPIEVQINSPGGDMFEGIAIYNVLREHEQPITVKIMGMAASAASIIAMAGDTVEIGTASFIMIHNCWVVTMGNRHDLEDTAKFLEPFDAAMVDLYAQRTKQASKDVAKWMDAETFMSGSMAIERGFADSLLAADASETDPAASSRGQEVNALRQAEIAMCAKMSRGDARALLNKIKGTPGAAHDDATPGAGETEWAHAASTFLETLKA